jgi:hypothetical protein
VKQMGKRSKPISMREPMFMNEFKLEDWLNKKAQEIIAKMK